MSASFALYKSSGQHFDRLPGHDDGGFSLSNANAAAVLDALRIEGSFSERPLADPLLPGAPHRRSAQTPRPRLSTIPSPKSGSRGEGARDRLWPGRRLHRAKARKALRSRE